MFRVWLIPVLALISVVIPSVAQAQLYVVPSCTDPAVMSRSSYDRPMPCVPLVPVPPTGVPAWLRPVPIPPPPASVVPIDPTPVYVPPSRGLDPWIPLAVRPTPAASPMDFTTQMLLLQQLAAARQYRAQRAAAPTEWMPASVPPPPPGEGWMSGFIKPVHPAK